MPGAALFAEIVVADLVDIKRHQIHGWMMVDAVPAVTVQKTIYDMLRVGMLKISGYNSG
jgi:hypothetical protein